LTNQVTEDFSNEVETAALANYTCSGWESSHFHLQQL